MRGDNEEDGELWGIDPTALNSAGGWKAGLMPPTYLPVHNLAKEAFDEPCDRVETPVAVLPRQTFSRVANQQSTFTIHPRPGESRTIVSVIPDSMILCQIPKNKKIQLRIDLSKLGVTN